MTITQQFIVKLLSMMTTIQIGIALFVALATYKTHTKVQRFNLFYISIMLFWIYFTRFIYSTTGSSHFIERFYVLIHLTMGINLVLIEAKSERLKSYTVYSFLTFLVIWLIYISLNELLKTSPILAGITYAYASVLMLFLLYDKISNYTDSLLKDPGMFIIVGTYIFYAGTAIIFILLQHYMVYWEYFPNARFYKPVLHIACNFIFYCLFIYSFLCNRSISN